MRTRDKNTIAATIEDAFMSTATVQLAMIAYTTGSAIKWDLQKSEITGNPDATRLLSREYRDKYIHP
jgi:hypothetical protein